MFPLVSSIGSIVDTGKTGSTVGGGGNVAGQATSTTSTTPVNTTTPPPAAGVGGGGGGGTTQTKLTVTPVSALASDLVTRQPLLNGIIDFTGVNDSIRLTGLQLRAKRAPYLEDLTLGAPVFPLGI